MTKSAADETLVIDLTGLVGGKVNKLKAKAVTKARTCIWNIAEGMVYEDSCGSYYQTECGQAFELSNEEPLNANAFRFCFYCGKRIEEKDDVNNY